MGGRGVLCFACSARRGDTRLVTTHPRFFLPSHRTLLTLALIHSPVSLPFPPATCSQLTLFPIPRLATHSNCSLARPFSRSFMRPVPTGLSLNNYLIVPALLPLPKGCVGMIPTSFLASVSHETRVYAYSTLVSSFED
jgi:hypothetical protein